SRAAGHGLELAGDRGGAAGEVDGGVGQQIVLDHVVAVDAEQVVGQGGEQASAVLAGGAVDQHGAVGPGQGAEIAAEQVEVGGFERQFPIGVGHEAAAGVHGQVGGS